MEIYIADERDGQALIDASSFMFTVIALVSLYRYGIMKDQASLVFSKTVNFKNQEEACKSLLLYNRPCTGAKYVFMLK